MGVCISYVYYDGVVFHLLIFSRSITHWGDPSSEYACSVWHTSLPNYLCNRIEQVQKRALRIIYPGLHYVDALEIAHCPRLDVRRQEICLQTFTKICDPGCRLHHLIPPIRSNAHGRTLRKLSPFQSVGLIDLNKVLSQPCVIVQQTLDKMIVS